MSQSQGVYVKLPNIYEGNYSLLVLFPLLLIVISLILLPNLKYGIELSGGMLITIQSSNQIDEQQIRSTLSQNGINSAEIRLYSNPAGYITEIETQIDSRILQIDDKIARLDSISKQVGDIESELARLRAEQQSTGKDLSSQISSDEQKLSALITEALSIEDEVFSLSKSLMNKEPTTQKYTGDEIAKIVKASNAVFSEAKLTYKEQLISQLSSSLSVKDIKLEEVSASLSRLFVNKVLNVALISALLAVVMIFLIFRTFVPSFAVLVGAFSDITMALGAMAFFGIPLTLASFATLMTLAALSLDTDMMLTIKTVKRREGTPRERAYDAFRTGFAMTTTVIVAFLVLMILGMVSHIPTYYQIGAVAVAGLIGDLIATWCLNSVLVLWYLEGKYEILTRLVKR
jgi:preprotein translocase subunit SecF